MEGVTLQEEAFGECSRRVVVLARGASSSFNIAMMRGASSKFCVEMTTLTVFPACCRAGAWSILEIPRGSDPPLTVFPACRRAGASSKCCAPLQCARRLVALARGASSKFRAELTPLQCTRPVVGRARGVSAKFCAEVTTLTVFPASRRWHVERLRNSTRK